MDNLEWAQDDCFDLIVALGIYHNATSEILFRKAIKESARVLRKDGWLLVANFAPGTQLGLSDWIKEKGANYLWSNKEQGKLCLLTGEELDTEMKKVSLIPVTKTASIKKQLNNEKRITVKTLYEKIN